MTELSRFWDTTTGGDAVDAPYDSSEMAEILMALGAAEAITTHKSGVFRGVDNGLSATPGANKLTLGTGKALVSGRYYKNTATLDITVPDATLGRRDRILLKRDTAGQTVRAVRIAGTDDNSGTAPSIPAGDASTWHMPLYTINQAAGAGASPTIITDERSYVPYHGDQGSEAGTKHSYGQISSAPAFGATPTTVTPGVASAVGATGTYAGGQHSHALALPPFAYTTANVTRSSTVTPTDDAQLKVDVLANKIYVIDAVILATTVGGSSGITVGLTIPSGTILSFVSLGEDPNTIPAPNTAMFGSTSNFMFAGLGGLGFFTPIIIRALVSIGGAAGLVHIQWSQHVLSPSDGTIVGAGSYVLATLVA